MKILWIDICVIQINKIIIIIINVDNDCVQQFLKFKYCIRVRVWVTQSLSQLS